MSATSDGTTDIPNLHSPAMSSPVLENAEGARQLRILQIKPNPFQPRRFFSDTEMSELVDSIKTHGLIQPILVRPVSSAGADAGSGAGDNESAEYQLVAGERRWRAAQMAGLDEIPAVIRSVGDQQALELALIENVQRHDISAIDAAIAYQRLASEFSLSQEQVAQRVGKSRSAVANTLRLLDLPQEVRTAIEDGTLSEGHGRAILLAPAEGARRAIFRRVLRDKLSVRETERLAQHSAAAEQTQSLPGPSSSERDGEASHAEDVAGDPDVERIESLLKKRLGTRLQVKMKRRGGEILVNFSSKEEFERIVKLILHDDNG
jgi:ParB family chromosome partitioning protein